MSIADIENASFAELKERRAELIDLLKTESVDALAARFVQARMDAKHRDEKLAEQALTLDALRTGLESTTQQAEAAVAEMTKVVEATKLDAAARIAGLQRELDARSKARAIALEEVAALTEANCKLSEELQRETARANRLKVEAGRNYAALSGAANLVNDALSQHALENADQGE